MKVKYFKKIAEVIKDLKSYLNSTGQEAVAKLPRSKPETNPGGEGTTPTVDTVVNGQEAETAEEVPEAVESPKAETAVGKDDETPVVGKSEVEDAASDIETPDEDSEPVEETDETESEDETEGFASEEGLFGEQDGKEVLLAGNVAYKVREYGLPSDNDKPDAGNALGSSETLTSENDNERMTPEDMLRVFVDMRWQLLMKEYAAYKSAAPAETRWVEIDGILFDTLRKIRFDEGEDLSQLVNAMLRVLLLDHKEEFVKMFREAPKTLY